MNNNDFKVYCGGFLFARLDNKYLLHLRDNNTIYNPNKWALFGGLKKDNETDIECFNREIKEEIGINIDTHLTKKVISITHSELKTKSNYYVCYVSSSNILINLKEGKDYGWFTKEDLIKLDLTTTTKSVIIKYIKNFC